MEFSDAELLAAHDRAPKAVQNALMDGVAIDFIIQISSRYKLHIDVAGRVTQLIRNMLLGLQGPGELMEMLLQAEISENTARKIIADLNTEVFIPVRDQVKEDGAVSSQSLPDSAPTNQVPAVTDQRTAEITPNPELRTMQTDMHARQVSAPIINISSQYSDIPAHITPAMIFQTASIPHTDTQIQEMNEIQENRGAQATPQSNPIINEYNLDPYREPIQ